MFSALLCAEAYGRSGVSKGVEDGRRLPDLPAATPDTAVRPFWGWPHAGRRGAEHGGP
jgi:hypothetical protein